jgi:hypothetical protein
MKGLIGKTEIKDALKRLDKLTQEEARMAAAQNLKVTHTVDDRVRGVADAVVAVDNRVAGVDDRVQQMVDEVKRLSFPHLISAIEPYPFSQGTNYGRAFTNGSLLRTPRRTTTSHVTLVTRKRQRGFFKAVSFRSGSQPGRFFGFTENVCHVLLST